MESRYASRKVSCSPARRGANETGSDVVRRLYASNLSTNSVGALAKSIGTRFQGGKSLNELAGLGPYYFVPYPQFMGGMYVIDSNDYSHYHGLEIRLTRAFASGMAFQFAYTLSKSMDTRSFDPTSTVVGAGTVLSYAIIADYFPVDVIARPGLMKAVDWFPKK